MSVLDYLRAKSAPLLMLAVGITVACLITVVCGCPGDAVAVMAALLALSATGAYSFDYARTRRFYRNLADLSEQLEHPYQLHSFLSEPLLADHAVVYEALTTMGVASAEEVAQANAKASEHRAFVEEWVHGIKAPLAACNLIAERVAEPERSQLSSELYKVGRNVDAALWYARSDCANRDYAIHELSLVDIPLQACRDNARFLIEQGCIPHISIDEGVKVFTDKKQAVFIVSQLVENSAKYGAHTLSITAEQAGADDGAQVVTLLVEDDGFGIPAEDVDRVFERGFTGTRGHESAASTGMGLFLAARLCEQLGLGLSLSSVEGQGTCVYLSFPLDRRRLDVQANPKTTD